ncbi:MAG: alpha/beta family hydrolase [Actinomycetota bacterium]|nr:alpha/beta family hydrolase [Actinomycetota bacterium]
MPAPACLFLTHGAGSDRNHSSLVALEERLAPLPVERVDFPYRTEGRRFPDRAPKLIEFVKETSSAAAAAAGIREDQIVLGGRSLGGRICSMAVAAGLPAAGLLLVCYPLHPPNKPENLRVDHFEAINVPCLFVSGNRDPFGSPEEFASYLPNIKGPVTTVWLPGARHDLAGQDGPICDAVAEWITTLT